MVFLVKGTDMNRCFKATMAHIRRQAPFLDEIKGFMAEDEGAALYDLGREQAGQGPCLEIGGYCGLSTVFLGLGVRERGGLLVSIDHHRGSEEHQPGQEYHDPDLYDRNLGCMDSLRAFRETIRRAGLEGTVLPIVASSALAAKAWTTPLALVFIDGGHSRAAALQDYRSWAPMVAPGGVLAIHDIFFDPEQGGQPPREIYDLALASGLFEAVELVNSLGILRRIEFSGFR